MLFLVAGEFIGEFGGEVIATQELNRRKRLYDAAGVGERFCFVFDLKCGLQIDASASGNNTRYMNSAVARANVTAVLVNDFGCVVRSPASFSLTPRPLVPDPCRGWQRAACDLPR